MESWRWRRNSFIKRSNAPWNQTHVVLNPGFATPKCMAMCNCFRLLELRHLYNGKHNSYLMGTWGFNETRCEVESSQYKTWRVGNVMAPFSRGSWCKLITRMKTRPSIFLSPLCCPRWALHALGCNCSISCPWECQVTEIITVPCKVLFSPTPHFLSAPRSAWQYSQSLERLRTSTSSSFIISFLQGERGQHLRMKDSPPCPLSAEALIHFSWPLAVTKAAAFSLVSVLHAISQSWCAFSPWVPKRALI